MPETWLILGATSIIAREFARRVASAGHVVILAGRDKAELERTAADLWIRFGCQTESLAYDVAKPVDHLLAFCLRVSGTLNVLMAVGALDDQAMLEAEPSNRRQIMEANYLGPVSVLVDLAQQLSARGGGQIVVLSSVAGDRGRGSNYIYGSAKAGLSAFAEGMAGRWFRDGVVVTNIKLGYVDTRMTFGLPANKIAASPQAVASAIYKAARAKKEITYVPWFWRWVMMAIRMVPAPIFKRIVI